MTIDTATNTAQRKEQDGMHDLFVILIAAFGAVLMIGGFAYDVIVFALSRIRRVR